MTDFVEAYNAWVNFYASVFILFPLSIVRNWVKRGSSDGFAPVSFIMAIMMTACWLRHSFLAQDMAAAYSNSFAMFMMIFYTVIFVYYKEEKKSIMILLSVAAGIIAVIYGYVGTLDKAVQVAMMGKIAAAVQNISIIGPIAQMRLIMSKGTTENAPFGFLCLVCSLIIQKVLLAFLQGNVYMAVGHAPGLLIQFAQLSLFYFYPPQTWRVPIIGTGPVSKDDDKKKD